MKNAEFIKRVQFDTPQAMAKSLNRVLLGYATLLTERVSNEDNNEPHALAVEPNDLFKMHVLIDCLTDWQPEPAE